jgi:hypothetical protein
MREDAMKSHIVGLTVIVALPAPQAYRLLRRLSSAANIWSPRSAVAAIATHRGKAALLKAR